MINHYTALRNPSILARLDKMSAYLEYKKILKKFLTILPAKMEYIFNMCLFYYILSVKMEYIFNFVPLFGVQN